VFGGGVGDKLVDTKPLEAKMAIEVLCFEIHQRVLKYLVDFCSRTSFSSYVLQQGVDDPVDADEITLDTYHETKLCIHLLDTPGWEAIPDGGNGFAQLLINFASERMNGHYVERAFLYHIRHYEEEGVNIVFDSVPEYLSAIDLYDRVPTGMINLLEETCLATRGDDKAYADKIMSTHTKGKLVKSAGHKSKITVFIIKHSFAELQYDCDGFVASNKNRLSPSGTQMLASVPRRCLFAGVAGGSALAAAAAAIGSGGAGAQDAADVAPTGKIARGSLLRGPSR
jgi:Myosin head (motor domain)